MRTRRGGPRPSAGRAQAVAPRSSPASAELRPAAGGRGRPAVTTPPKLLGRYRTPRFAYGAVVRCARRGDVRIVGLSEAPIPWPIGQTLPKGRARSLVLYGALAEAVKRESSEAVAYWWGVTAQTVTIWRKALDVGRMTEGTTALMSERLSPVLERAREAAAPTWTSPERGQKI